MMVFDVNISTLLATANHSFCLAILIETKLFFLLLNLTTVKSNNIVARQMINKSPEETDIVQISQEMEALSTIAAKCGRLLIASDN